MGRIQARQDPCESTGHKGNQSGNGMYGAFLASGDDEYKDAWQETNVNVLSKSTAPFNDVVGTHTLRAYQVRISKADSAPEGIWQKPEDFVNWLPLGKA